MPWLLITESSARKTGFLSFSSTAQSRRTVFPRVKAQTLPMAIPENATAEATVVAITVFGWYLNG
jgi:hypothetical protein